MYKFGFGLSFSQFKYSQLTVDTAGFPDLAVGVVVENTGAVAAAAVAQLYVSVPEAGEEGVPKGTHLDRRGDSSFGLWRNSKRRRGRWAIGVWCQGCTR